MSNRRRNREFKMSRPKYRFQSRRARAALLWGLVMFSGLQLGLAIAIEYWLPELRDPNYAHRAALLRRRIGTESNRSLTVVMLGSSRTGVALKGTLLDARLSRAIENPVIVFNFGLPGAGPVTELLNLKRLLADRVRPDLLLIEVLPPLLGGKDAVPWEAAWISSDRLWHGEIESLAPFGFATRELRSTWWQAWPIPWYSHRFAILNLLAPGWLPWHLRQDWSRGTDDSGWTAHPEITPEFSRLATERARQEYAVYLDGFRLGGPALRALQGILYECQRAAIPAGLVLLPEGTAFQSWYPPGAWEQISAFLQNLSLQSGAPLINARSWLPDEDFSDSHHLLRRGAVKFSERLAQDALLPLLKRRKASATASEFKARPLWDGHGSYRLTSK
ncbi:MAG TPA: DUF1574 family protein [Acidobacteriota bacterium]|nr:DUF1574 family protein [Acidobacteriota bacterium]